MPDSPQSKPSSAVIRRRRVVALLLVIGLIGGVAYLNRASIRAGFDVAFGAEYVGAGAGSVEITIRSGDDGSDVARALVDAGVTKTFSATYKSIIAEDLVFYPGVFKLAKGMNSRLAVAALKDRSNFVDISILIKEGTRASTIFKMLSEKYGTPLADFEKVKPSDLGLPKEAVNLDGYLFPAKYTFDPGQSAISMLKTMHQRMVRAINEAGVKPVDVHRILTMASIIQREGRYVQDFYKISRVFYNRLDINMALQSDATVSYAAGTVSYTTTEAQRAADNPWNTYRHPGLPIGPISAPGSDAIDAALHPAKGTWIFFCTVNLETGETEFTTTLAEHEASVAKWRAWMKANPGW
jgi:UPF0755 protein